MDAQQKSTSLATVPALPTRAITNSHDLSEQLRGLQQHFNVISPAIAVSELAQGFGANLATVLVDHTIVDAESGRGTETYRSKKIHKDHERALAKVAMLKLSQAAGIQWDLDRCRRIDNRQQRYFWEWQYVGTLRTHDGQMLVLRGSRELDLRDGSAEAQGMSDRQLQQQRSFGNEICETKAMERAIRAGLALRQVYTVEELKKPFLLVRFSFMPDMNDPEIKRLVTERALSGVGMLYQPPAAPALELPPAPEEDAVASTTEASPTQTRTPTGRTVEAVDFDPEVGLYSVRLDGGEMVITNSHELGKALAQAKKAGSRILPTVTEAGELTAFTVAPAPGSATASAPVALTVTHVDKKTGKKTNGSPWTLYIVTFSTGKKATTFSETLHALIDEAAAQKATVKVDLEEAEGDRDDRIVKFEIVDKRQGGLPMGEDKY